MLIGQRLLNFKQILYRNTKKTRSVADSLRETNVMLIVEQNFEHNILTLTFQNTNSCDLITFKLLKPAYINETVQHLHGTDTTR